MTNYSEPLDLIFQALADPTRRKVLERLSLGPASVSELAAPFAMALPSFLQHLKVLEQSGLVSSEKLGRVRTFQIVQAELQQVRTWLGQLATWERRFEQLDTYILELAKQEKENE
ncbi:MAG: ArsR/SmtB family transcription factor [Candidatus Sericytochromatia bacterium]